MAKRRKGNNGEVMLIPFLDILCSLIGILILIIVVLCVANTQQTNGRTVEEADNARKFDELSRQQKSLATESQRMNTKVAELETLETDAIAKQTRLTELKIRLNLVGDDATANKAQAARIQKQIEDLLLQVEALARQMPPIQHDIEELKKQLAFRNKKPDDKPVPVVIQSSGTGLGGQKKLCFVETSNGTITLRKDRTDKRNIATGSLVSDKTYNDFLAQVKSTPDTMLIFLIRPDGAASYDLAAGLAQSKYGLLTGKLPIPGAGEVDLNAFYKN